LKGGSPFIHNSGTDSTFIGEGAGNFAMTGNKNSALGARALQNNADGYENTAAGADALRDNASGVGNSAFGAGALVNNSSGDLNVAVGAGALGSNLDGFGNAAVGTIALALNAGGNDNVAIGYNALYKNFSGSGNTAIGGSALWQHVTGQNNIAIGKLAGVSLTAGDNNIVIGNSGTVGDSGTIRIGNGTDHLRAYIAGVRGVTTGSANAIPVLIDSSGQLGTVSSSRRYKDDVVDMDAASSSLMQLRPVTFHYKSDRDPAGRTLQYGLIAEEVAEVNPGLVARSADGQIETVMYQFLPPMLLNEFQKQQRTIAAQARELAELRRLVELLLSRTGTKGLATTPH
jgi:hypothetical protein